MRRLISFFVSLFFIAGGVWAALHYQFFVDQYVAATYTPSSQMSRLIDEVGLSNRSDFLVRATQASLDDREAFNRHCDKKDSGSITLGCYIGPQHLYVYNVQDSQLEGVRQVTLAHEMLHAAYERLSGSERSQVNRKINNALPAILSEYPDLQKRLQVYEKTEPGERNNELHSIIGSEVASLPKDLEEYYQQYFNNRQIVTDFAKKYAKVFQSIKDSQDTLIAELENLTESINQQVAAYNKDIETLNSRISDFNNRASRFGGFVSQSEFEAEKSQLQSEKDRLDTEKANINARIAVYEEKRAQLEALNVQVEDLNTKLDSTKLPSL